MDAQDSLKRIIVAIPDHRQYHTDLVSHLDATLSSLTHHQTNNPSTSATYERQLKKLVNQSLSTLTRWSKVLHSPDQTNVIAQANTLRTNVDPSKATSTRSNEVTNLELAAKFPRTTRSTRLAQAPPTQPKANDSTKSTLLSKGCNIPTKSFYDTDQPTYAHIAILVDMSFLGLETLEDISQELTAGVFEVEKARSNLVSKIIELGMKKRALRELGRLQKRLILGASAIWTSDPKTAKNTMIHPTLSPHDAKSLRGFPQSSTDSLKRDYQHLFSISIPNLPPIPVPQSNSLTISDDHAAQTLALLVVALQTNAIRCWMDVRNGSLTYLLNEMLQQPDSPVHWSIRLAKLNPQSAQRPLDAFFRLLFIAASKTVECDKSQEGLRHAFQLRLLGLRFYAINQSTPESAQGSIWEKILRCGVDFDKAILGRAQDEDNRMIMESYKSIYDFVKDHATIDHQHPSYSVWCKHLMFVARRAENSEFIKYAHVISNKDTRQDTDDASSDSSRSTVQQVESGHHNCGSETRSPLLTRRSPFISSSACSENFLVQLSAAVTVLVKFEELVVSWQNEPRSGTELNHCISDTRLAITRLQQVLATSPQYKFTKETLQHMARVFRSMDTLRSLGSKIMDMHEKYQTDAQRNTTAATRIPVPDHQEMLFQQSQLLAATVEIIQLLSDLTEALWTQGKVEYKALLTSSPKACPSPAKLSCARVDAILFLFRVHSKQSTEFNENWPAQKPIVNYLDSALAMAKDMLDTESLPWISSAFYNHGGALFKAGRQSEAVWPLRQSVDSYQYWFDNLSKETLHAVHDSNHVLISNQKHLGSDHNEERTVLVNRYEVLGVCHLALNDVERALSCFERGLVTLPLVEFLRLENVTFKNVPSRQPIAAKLLNRRVRAITMQDDTRFVSVTEIKEMMERLAPQDGIPIVIQGIIQEHEYSLLSAFGIKTNQMLNSDMERHEIMRRLIYKVYRGGRAMVNPIRRARVLILHATDTHGRRDQKDRHEALNLIEEAIEILKENDLKGDRDLECYRSHHLAMAYTWRGILGRIHEESQSCTMKPFQIALQLWEAILSRVECFVSFDDAALPGQQQKREDICRFIPDPEHLAGHLQMIADCLGVIDDRVTQVQAFRLMLRLSNGVLPVNESTCADAVRIYISMSQAYLSLGYSGKAKAALSIGKSILKEMSTSSTNLMSTDQIFASWLLAQCLYLTTIGNTHDGSVAFNQARSHSVPNKRYGASISHGVYSSHLNISGVSPHLLKAEAKAYKALIVSEACLARSQLLFQEGDLPEAISDALRAVRQLSRIVGTLSKAVQGSRQDSSLIQKKEMANPFLVPTPTTGKNNDDQTRVGANHQLHQGLQTLVSQRYQWSVFKLLIEAFYLLSKLYLALGCGRETKYFLDEGKHVARLTKTGKSLGRFLLQEAELGLRRHEWEQSQEILLSLDMQDDVSLADALAWEIQDARIQLMYGDLYDATSLYDQSMKAYYRTEQILSHLMDKSVISELERLVIREPQTPREKRLVKVFNQQNDTARTMIQTSLNMPYRTSSYRRMDSETREQTLFECVTLGKIKAMVGYRTGATMAKLGKRAEAFEVIEKSKNEDLASLTAAEYHATKAKVLMTELDDMMGLHLMYAMLPDSTMSAGLIVKSRVSRMAPMPSIFVGEQLWDDDLFLGSSKSLAASPSVRRTRTTKNHPPSIQSPLWPRPGLPVNSVASTMTTQRYLSLVNKAQIELRVAYDFAVNVSPPHVLSGIGSKQAYLAMLESCLLEEERDGGDDSSRYSGCKSLALRVSCYLEMSKAITVRREMHGLIKQKLDPPSPQDEQEWPQDIFSRGQRRLHQHQGALSTAQISTGYPLLAPNGVPSELRTFEAEEARLQLPSTLQSRFNESSTRDEQSEFPDFDVSFAKVNRFTNLKARHEHLDLQSSLSSPEAQGNTRSFLQSLDDAYSKDWTGYSPEGFLHEFIETIPSNWTVVSMSMDIEKGVLCVNRLRAGAMPIVVRLPLNRGFQREAEDEHSSGSPLSYQDAVDELQDIMKSSQETLIVSGQVRGDTSESTDTAVMTRDEKAEWWLQRKRLDVRLNVLLDTMEDQWLGGLKGIIQSHNTPAEDANLMELKTSLEWIMTRSVNKVSRSSLTATSRGHHDRVSAGECSIVQMEIDIDFCRVISHLGDDPTPGVLRDLIYFLLDVFTFKSGGTPPASAPPATQGMPGIFSASPPNQSRATSASPCAVYADLDIREIADHIKKALQQYWLSETEAKNNGFDEGSHVILILDKHLQIFPWESCPGLREEAVSRLPSICFLRDRILQQRHKYQQQQLIVEDLMETDTESQQWTDVEVDPRRTFYVLNPGADLKNTEHEFRDYVTRQPGWKGIIGRAPLDMECIKGMANNDLYIYFGHSGGEQYVRSHQIRQLGQCGVSLLLGCSSGSLKSTGEFDPTGSVLNFLLAGCPTVVANLWDVTDKDLDRFSKAMFSEWGLDRNLGARPSSDKPRPPRQSIVEAVKVAREKCLLRISSDWPRLVIGMISLYGACYASALVHAAFITLKTKDESDRDVNFEPISFAAASFLPQFQHDAPASGSMLQTQQQQQQQQAPLPPFFASTTVASAVYIFVVLSGLSVIDSIIGLMVVTRRSLRLTQIALGIWCLRFLFRVLSLIAVLFMFAVHTHAGTRLQLEQIHMNGDSDNKAATHSRIATVNDDDEFSFRGSMLMVQLLDVTVGLVHGCLSREEEDAATTVSVAESEELLRIDEAFSVPLRNMKIWNSVRKHGYKDTHKCSQTHHECSAGPYRFVWAHGTWKKGSCHKVGIPQTPLHINCKGLVVVLAVVLVVLASAS
ncbi:hypothetical protein BG004_004650 [Podila humilis]|nr:hypothetical protein BG004_004650 [Podila humilis]